MATNDTTKMLITTGFHWPLVYEVKKAGSEEVLARFRFVEDAEWFASHRPPLDKDGYE